MKVFLTGATGFIGSAIVLELIEAGHQVLGLARSEATAESLIAAGAEVHRGSLEDLDSLRSGAGKTDGVIHCAFGNDFSKIAASSEQESRVIAALGDELMGSDRPLLISSVAAMGIATPGHLATEDHFDPSEPFHSVRVTEKVGAAVADRGVNVSVVRLPQVHNATKHGLATFLIQVARQKKISAYIGDGLNRWAAAHVLDVAHLYRLVLEKHEAGSRYHAVAEEGIPLRQIAEVIGTGLQVPVISLPQEEAQSHFGPTAMLVYADMAASSRQTQHRLGWHPTGPGLIHGLEQTHRS
jgi:nucleoside-diphosphate-sugar epimerase